MNRRGVTASLFVVALAYASVHAWWGVPFWLGASIVVLGLVWATLYAAWGQGA